MHGFANLHWHPNTGESNVFVFSCYFKYGGPKLLFVLLVMVTNASGSLFKPSNVLVLLTIRFTWFGAGALGVKRQRPGLKLGSGSEPALELLWWKRSNSGSEAGFGLVVCESLSREI